MRETENDKSKLNSCSIKNPDSCTGRQQKHDTLLTVVNPGWSAHGYSLIINLPQGHQSPGQHSQPQNGVLALATGEWKPAESRVCGVVMWARRQRCEWPAVWAVAGVDKGQPTTHTERRALALQFCSKARALIWITSSSFLAVPDTNPELLAGPLCHLPGTWQYVSTQTQFQSNLLPT